MFCTQCGTQIDPGDNFCRGCGGRTSRGAGPSPAPLPPLTSAEPSGQARPVEAIKRGQQSMPLSPPRSGADGNKTKIIAIAAVVTVLAAAAIYVGTDLLREPTPQKTIVTEGPGGQTGEVMPSHATEANNSSVAGNAKAHSSLSEAIPPEAASRPPSETPAPAPKPAAREPRVRSGGQDTQALNRTNRPPASASRRNANSGIYQTLRSTTLFESPSASSRSVANIPGGVRVNVVSASGDWLEVHSLRGNPPGFIRREDAQFIESSQ